MAEGTQEEDVSGIGIVVCKNCKAANQLTGLTCSNCGKPLLPQLEVGYARRVISTQASPVVSVAFDTSAIQDPFLLNLRGTLYIVAEQIGGKAYGSNLAQYAADLIKDAYYNAPPGMRSRAALKQAFTEANQAFFERYNRNGENDGLCGVSCVAVVVRGEILLMAHMGDCRAYLLRGSQFSPLTLDHSWARESGDRLLQDGEISLEEYQSRQYQLTRCLGWNTEVFCEAGSVLLEDADQLLLCNRGIWQGSEESQLKLWLKSDYSAQTRAEELLNKPDNSAAAPPGQTFRPSNKAVLVIQALGVGSNLDRTYTQQPDDTDNLNQYYFSDPLKALEENLLEGKFLKALPGLHQLANAGNHLAALHLEIAHHFIQANKSEHSNNLEQLEEAAGELELALARIIEADFEYVYPLAQLNLRGLYLRIVRVALKANSPSLNTINRHWRRFMELSKGDFTAEEQAVIARLKNRAAELHLSIF